MKKASKSIVSCWLKSECQQLHLKKMSAYKSISLEAGQLIVLEFISLLRPLCLLFSRWNENSRLSDAKRKHIPILLSRAKTNIPLWKEKIWSAPLHIKALKLLQKVIKSFTKKKKSNIELARFFQSHFKIHSFKAL